MTLSVHRYFTPEEIARLEEDSFRFEDCSSALLVPFSARKLKSPRIVWLNERWFLQHGLDVADPGQRHRVASWLIDEFGYCVGERSGANGLLGEIRTFYADRYGSTEGTTPHGGSGRAGIAGRFQAKGIGPTPLVGTGADPGHAHGCASLEECIREAIYSEIFAAEFPFGAVPVVAVLDTGLRFSDPDAQVKKPGGTRRGILVRPTVLRPAHAERASLFKRFATGGESPQVIDVARTRDVVRHWMSHRSGNGVGMTIVPPEEFLSRVTEQISFGQLSRLFNGGYFSSNLSTTGALLDFGNAHALPDWSKAKVLDHAPGFGDEMLILGVLIRSMAFFQRKFAPPGSGVRSEPDWQAYVKAKYEESFAKHCLGLFGIAAGSAAGEGLVGCIRKHFDDQQRRRVNYKHGLIAERSGPGSIPWIGDHLAVADSAMSGEHPGSRLAAQIDAALTACLSGCDEISLRRKVAYLSARRRLGGRTVLDRAQLMKFVEAELSAFLADGKTDGRGIELAIARVVGQGRRHWPRLPHRYGVRASFCHGSSSALLCMEWPTARQLVWVEGVHDGRNLHFLDRRVSALDVDSTDLEIRDGSWRASIPVESLESWLSSRSKLAELLSQAPGSFHWHDDRGWSQ